MTAVTCTGGQEISYKRKKAGGGELDVDMCLLLRNWFARLFAEFTDMFEELLKPCGTDVC